MILACVAIAIQLPFVAEFVYQLPIVSYIQFSWRWNILLVPAISVMVGMLFLHRERALTLLTGSLVIVTIAIVVSFNSKYERHHSPELLKIEYSDAFEYMPRTTLTRNHAIADFVGKHRTDPPVLLSGPGTASLISQAGDRREYQIDAAQPAEATFHLFYWPQWQAKVNGGPLRLSHDSLGRATALLHAGSHRVTIDRSAHPSESIGAWISLAALVGLIGSLIYSRKS
jgi:hypothetical protein